jgi:hypothetical protein
MVTIPFSTGFHGHVNGGAAIHPERIGIGILH